MNHYHALDEKNDKLDIKTYIHKLIESSKSKKDYEYINWLKKLIGKGLPKMCGV